jgi:hypothetical protein
LVEGKNLIAPLSAVAGEEFDNVRAECAKQAAELCAWYKAKLNVIWLSCVQGRDASRMLADLPGVHLALRENPQLPALNSLHQKVLLFADKLLALPAPPAAASDDQLPGLPPAV